MTAPDTKTITADLRQQILTGTLPPGSKLKEEELASDLGVDRSVIRLVFKALRTERLVAPRKGLGTIVLDPTGRDRIRRTRILRDERGYFLESLRLSQNGKWEIERNVMLQHFGVQLDQAPVDIVPLLGTDPSALVIVRDRVLGLKRDPAAGRPRDLPRLLSTSYLPEWVAQEVPAVREKDPGPGGIYDRIEETLGGPLTWKMLIHAELATPEVAKKLSIPSMSAILRLRQTVTAPDGRVVSVLDQRSDGDQYELEFPIERGESARWPVRGLDQHGS